MENTYVYLVCQSIGFCSLQRQLCESDFTGYINHDQIRYMLMSLNDFNTLYKYLGLKQPNLI